MTNIAAFLQPLLVPSMLLWLFNVTFNSKDGVALVVIPAYEFREHASLSDS